MTLILSGTDGLSDIDGSAATPAIRGTDTNTGIFFPAADTIALSEGGTEAMRIDSSGNLLVGTTTTGSPGISLTNNYNIGWTQSAGESIPNIFRQTSSAATVVANGYRFSSTSNGFASSFSSSYAKCAISCGTVAGAITFYTDTAATVAAGTDVTPTERMRIDTSGNVGIGTTSPVGKIESKTATVAGGSADYAQKAFVANIPYSTTNVISSLLSGWDGSSIHGVDVGYTYNGTGYNLIFSTNDNTSGNPIERARITSTGIFFVGVTSQQGGGSHCIQAGTGVNSLQMQNNGAIPYGPYINFSAAAPNNASQYFIQCTDTAATRVLLYSNGGLANYQANNVNLSDRREKTNFAPAGEYLSKICAIPVQTFNYIDQSEDDPGLTLGVVAQDVQAVAPELVMESNWGTKDDPKMRLSIYQTDLQYALMKCIQELKAINDAQAQTIQSLTARIEALEGK